MKKLYYVVQRGYEEKTITVYTIENNEPKHWFELVTEIENNSEEIIQDWLDDNGYSDSDIDKIEL